MIQHPIAKRVNGRLYYGWVIVFVAALSMFFSSPGQTYSISAFIDAYINEFGFSRTLISSIYSIATFISGLLMVLMGKLVDRFGEKWMLIVAGTLLALTTFYNSFVFTIPMLAIGFFLSRFFGQGALTLIPGTLVPQWFKVHRGIAFSILKFGVSIASVVVPLFNVYMITNFGWQATWRLWSIGLLILFIPLVLLLVIDTPEEIGLRPDNIELKPEEVEEEARDVEANSWHVLEAMTSMSFWKLGLITMIGPAVTTGIVFHFYSVFGEKGISSSDAAMALGLMGVPGFVFSLFSGYWIDRYGVKKVLVSGLALMASGIALLMVGGQLTTAIISVLIYGVGSSVYFVCVGVTWPNYFGRKYLGSIQGIATFFGVMGSAFGPWPFGYVYDQFGSYNLILMMVVVVIVLGIVLALSNKPPIKRVVE